MEHVINGAGTPICPKKVFAICGESTRKGFYELACKGGKFTLWHAPSGNVLEVDQRVWIMGAGSAFASESAEVDAIEQGLGMQTAGNGECGRPDFYDILLGPHREYHDRLDMFTGKSSVNRVSLAMANKTLSLLPCTFAPPERADVDSNGDVELRWQCDAAAGGAHVATKFKDSGVAFILVARFHGGNWHTEYDYERVCADCEELPIGFVQALWACGFYKGMSSLNSERFGSVKE